MLTTILSLVALVQLNHQVKKADEDIFLAALTIWTDNGAATLGAAWRPTAGTSPPPYTKLGKDVSFMNWNWSMVDEKVLGNIAADVRSKGVAPRAAQLDCWWYPVSALCPLLRLLSTLKPI